MSRYKRYKLYLKLLADYESRLWTLQGQAIIIDNDKNSLYRAGFCHYLSRMGCQPFSFLDQVKFYQLTELIDEGEEGRYDSTCFCWEPGNVEDRVQALHRAISKLKSKLNLLEKLLISLT